MTKQNNKLIVDFLKKAKSAAKDKNRRIFRKRTENMITLSMLGMTIDDVWDVIQGLTTLDYLLGPEPDDQGRDEYDVWFFKKRLYGKDIYIKMSYKEHRQLIDLFSFHYDR